MFTRKLTVMVVPLLMCLVICTILKLVAGTGFFYYLLGGLILGAFLSLVLPVTGAVSAREPFGTLLWVPSLLLALIVLCQFLITQGVITSPVLALLAISQPSEILVECAFIGFLITTCFRTKVYR